MLQHAIRGCAALILLSGVLIMFSPRGQQPLLETATAAVAEPQPEDQSFIDTARLHISLEPKGSYGAALNSIEKLRSDLEQSISKSQLQNSDSLLQIAGRQLEQKIVNEVLPFWYGTEWDFNGTTDTPGTGKIACGYLVSTVLKHCGFNLNRYTLAQQSAWNEARTLQLSDKVQYIAGDHEHFAEKFKQLYDDGLYLVGLDYHVGLLLLRKGELFFIHSSYLSPAETVIEKVALSQAFQSSRGYHIAEITTNLKLLRKWVLQEKIEVRKDS